MLLSNVTIVVILLAIVSLLAVIGESLRCYKHLTYCTEHFYYRTRIGDTEQCLRAEPYQIPRFRYLLPNLLMRRKMLPNIYSKIMARTFTLRLSIQSCDCVELHF